MSTNICFVNRVSLRDGFWGVVVDVRKFLKEMFVG